MGTFPSLQRILKNTTFAIITIAVGMAMAQFAGAAPADDLGLAPSVLSLGAAEFLPSNKAIASTACGAPSAKAASPDSQATELLFYSIPSHQLQAERNEIEIKAWVNDEVFLSETFSIQKAALVTIHERDRKQKEAALDGQKISADDSHQDLGSAVFEFLGERPELRSELLQLAHDSNHRIEIEVLANGRSLAHRSFSDFYRESEQALNRGGLPVASKANARAFPISTKPGSPQGFEVCGDGVCAGGMPPLGENCESCPSDCGGACSICGNGYCGGTERCYNCEADCGVCQNCPTDLGNANRTQYLGSESLGISCRSGAGGSSLHDLLKNNYKQWTVHRTEECDGSITETIVPGTTIFYSQYCYSSIGIFCPFPTGTASPSCGF